MDRDVDARCRLAPANAGSLRAARSAAARPPRGRAAMTLIEVLITITILGILAAVLIPQLSSDVPERLEAVAQIVAADLDYARGLAVAGNSQYSVEFDPDDNLYYVQHTGSNNLLDVLPASAFQQSDDPPDRQTTVLSKLPIPEPQVRLAGAVRMAGLGQATPNVDFTALGGTTSQVETVVWLACGSEINERFISIHIHPITGLTEIGPLQGELPGGVATVLNFD